MNNETADNISVFLRFCPINDLEAISESCVQILDEETRVKLNLSTSSNKDEVDCDFTFDKVFEGDTPQLEIYDKIGSPLVKEFLLGKNCCIFTYGETSTGKTHTLIGPDGYSQTLNDDISSLSSCGVSEAPIRPQPAVLPSKHPPRLVNFPDELRSTFPATPKPESNNLNGTYLSPMERMMHANKNHMPVDPRSKYAHLNSSSKRKVMRSSGREILFDGIEDAMARTSDDTGILPLIMKDIFDNIYNENMVRFSMYEIDQEKIRDLLGPKEMTEVLTIRENTDGVFVDGITQVGCTNESQVMGLIERGIENRNNSGARMRYGQKHFDRSHTIFEITSEYYDKDRGIEMTNTFRIVDLAGFDNNMMDAIDGVKRRLYVKSLESLRNVVLGLASAAPNVTYHNSKLTQILQDRLTGECKTALVITASPSYLHVSETMKTLQFGKQVRMIIKSLESDDDQTVERYKAKLEVSERTRRELMEIIAELEKSGVKMPKRKSIVSMTSIIEEEDADSIGSFYSEKLSVGEQERIQLDLNNMEEKMEDDLATARSELKNVSVLLQSTSEEMDKELSAVQRLTGSKSRLFQDTSNKDLSPEDIDANIKAAKKELSMKLLSSSSAKYDIQSIQNKANQKEVERKLEEREALLRAKEEELKALQKENKELSNTVKKRENEFTTATKKIEVLSKKTSQLEKSLKDLKSEEKDLKNIQLNGNMKIIEDTVCKEILRKHLAKENSSFNAPDIPDEESKLSISSDEKTDSMRVCLRIRPMSKLETSRRSRDCIAVHKDSQKVTVDSPLDGKYDFTYDKVFPTNSTQSMVFEYVGIPVVSNLLAGINSCIVAYGLKHSGKTTTLFGSTFSGQAPESNGGSPNNKGHAPEDGDDYGILPRIVKGIFDEISKTNDNLEFTVRCSFVSIYLEKFFDLLDPNVKQVMYTEEDDHGIKIRGACRPLCFNEMDVFALLLRGRASHTALANHSKLDIDISSLIFNIELEQWNSKNGLRKVAQLQVADIFGYDMTRKSQIITDTKLIHQSAKSLEHVITSLTKGESHVPYNEAKLTHVLKNAFGGNCKTTVIVTVSPSSFNISKAVKGLRFGQEVRKIRNDPRVNHEFSTRLFKKWLVASEIKLGELSDFVMELAREICAKKEFSKVISSELWKSIIAIVREEAVVWNPCRKAMTMGRLEDLERSGLKWKALTIFLLKSFSLRVNNEFDDDVYQIKSLLSDIQCEVHVLRTQNKLLREENNTKTDLLNSVENELKSTKLKISVMENELNRSKFKEKLATSLLLHLRKLCWRLQHDLTKNRAAQIAELIASLNGMPDLSGLVDVDALLLDFGFITKREVDDESRDQTFLTEMRSIYEEQSTETNKDGLQISQISSLKNMFSGSSMVNITSLGEQSKSDSELKTSTFNLFGSLQNVGKKQSQQQIHSDLSKSESATRISRTSEPKPTNWLNQAEIQNELRQMTRQCIELKLRLSEEQSHVESLANRTGPLMRKGLSQEVVRLRRENEISQNDLRAAAWKLQEMHVVNEVLETQTIESKRHISFLENDFHDLQAIFRETIAESHQKETQLREQLRKIEKTIASLLEPQTTPNQTEERVLPKMNIPPKGLSPSIPIQRQNETSSSSSTSVFNKKGNSLSSRERSKLPRKTPCKKANRRIKYLRRSRKNGDAIAGMMKKKLTLLQKQSYKSKLPTFEGIIDLQESKESQIARDSYFILNSREYG